MIGPTKSLDDMMNGTSEIKKADKQAVLYLHIQGTDYECKDCILFVRNQRCIIHHSDDVIKETDSCGLFIYGRYYDTAKPLGIVTPKQSGLTHSTNGFSCKRCEYFNSDENKCEKVDENSDGDDKGIIHPDACCNAWESNQNNEE